MLILEIAAGIVLGYLLLCVINTDAFWKILFSILGVGLVILVVALVVANIDTIYEFLQALLMILPILALVYLPAFIYLKYMNSIRYRKIKMIIYKGEKRRIKIVALGEIVALYNDMTSNKEAEERFFKEKKLDIKNYKVEMIKKDEKKDTWLYTKIKNSK